MTPTIPRNRHERRAMNVAPEGPWRDVEEAAAYLRFAKSTLDKLRVNGGGPPYSKTGKRVIYHVDDLDAWAASRRRESTSDMPPLEAA